MYRQRVRLTCDLTRYRPGLVAGTLGWTDPRAHATYGVMVSYDNGAYLDTLWRSLDVLKEETAAEQRRVLEREFDGAVHELLRNGATPKELRARVSAAAKAVKPQTPKQSV